MITHPRKTEQTGCVLETEIVAGVFPPVAEDNAEYSIESYLALNIYVTVINTHTPHEKWKHPSYLKPVCYMSDEVFRAIGKSKKKKTYGPDW